MVTAYVDEQLGAMAATRVRRHLEDCWPCNQDAEFARLIKLSLRQRPRREHDLGVVRLRRWVAQF